MSNKYRSLPSDLSWRNAFLFPLKDSAARRDVLEGGLLILFLWPIGWVLNLGNRLNMVARLANGEKVIFTGFRPWKHTFWRGCISATAIFLYLSPTLLLSYAAFSIRKYPRYDTIFITLVVLAICCFVLGIFTLPGCMTVFAVEGDKSILKKPVKAFLRAWAHRKLYAKAWAIALVSILCSFLGLLGLGIGFLFTSVWAWEVVGYAFTVAMYNEVD
jgi:hypothetical protein